MPSQLRSDTARANGAKSRGPKSAETKEKSSRNSLRHGFTSRHTMLLECEDEDEFQELEDDFAATYQPATPAEQNLVDEMVIARWRINRIRTIETVIMDCEMVRKKAEIEKTFLQPDSGIHMGMAFRTLAEESRSLDLCNRYESRFSRMYDRAYRTLRELQQKAAEPKKQKAEPEPPEPPKPNGGIQIATAPERVQPSEPETKNEETNPSAPVATALLRAVSPSSRTKAAGFKGWLVGVVTRLVEVGFGGIVGASITPWLSRNSSSIGKSTGIASRPINNYAS